MANRTRHVLALVLLLALGPAGAGSVARATVTDPPSTSGAAAALAARPNIVLILTDDQSSESLPRTPAAMPYLQERMNDPADHWVRFSNAFLNTPLCCPSRSTILTGQYSNHTGVTDNGVAKNFRDGATLATWLHGAGYRTALFGKYFNNYPFGRGPFVPPGWDRWAAFAGGDGDPFYNYTLAEDGVEVRYGGTEADYSTDVLASKATDFVASAPATQPFFLYFAPAAPHYPHTPPARYAGAFPTLQPVRKPSFDEADVSDKPAWVRALPRLTPERTALLDGRRRDSYRSLLAVDDAVEGIMGALQAKGALENTVVIFLSDNGLTFGEHRWNEKLCPYDECIRTPLLIRYPDTASRTEARLVGNVDLAPTILSLTGVTGTIKQDGRNLAPLLRGTPPGSWRSGMLLYWKGNTTDPVTGYWGVRTFNYLYTELTTGERELYDLTGRNGTADPYQLDNRAGRASYATIQSQLAATLAQLRGQ